MERDHKNIAFVLGGSINSLGVVKALGRKRVPTVIVYEKDRIISKYSRYAKLLLSPDPVKETESYIEFLIQTQKKYQLPGVLLPTSDVTVMAVSKYREELSSYFKFIIPPASVIEKITSKEGFRQLAYVHNLPIPRTVSVDSVSALEEVMEQLDYPCALKPYYSHFWRTSAFREKFGRMQIYIVQNPSELLDGYRKFAEYDPRMVIQDYIQGNDDCEYSLHTYTSRDGNHMINFLAHKLRLDPIHSGSAAFIQTAHNPEIVKLGNDFLKALEYRGMSSFQFKWDTVRKKFFAIELNPRYSLWNFLEPSCGINYPYMNYLDSLGLSFDIPPDYEDGVKWFSIERDISAFQAYRAEGSLTFGAWIKSYRGKKYCAEFSWDDPLPFLYFAWEKMKTLPFSLGRKLKFRLKRKNYRKQTQAAAVIEDK